MREGVQGVDAEIEVVFHEEEVLEVVICVDVLDSVGYISCLLPGAWSGSLITLLVSFGGFTYGFGVVVDYEVEERV